MEFCSKYGYNYGFEGSDSEEYSDEDEKTKEKIKKKIRKADTNIIAVKFDRLVAANEMFAGEPKICKKCEAYMSFLSGANTLKVDDKLIWTCEFCMEANDMTGVVDDLNEIPKKDDITFMLELPKPKESETTATASATDKQVSDDDSYFGFCIDNSGSMNGNIPVNNSANNMDQNNRQKIYTRLNGVKVSCMEAIKKLKDEEPKKRVALITFSDTVKYYGDCTDIRFNKPHVTIGGHNRSRMFYSRLHQPQLNTAADDDNEIQSTPQDLENKERVLTFANNLSGDLKGIAQSYPAIENRLKELRSEGSTALGPALLFSIGFAAKKPGSSIILCTDGCANVGIGSIESQPGEESEKFYDEVADYARERGVVVNVFSMEGTDCKLALLGRVADRSNGTMNIVNPLNLSDEFASILQNRIVATNVVAKLIVNHKYLYIRDDKLETEEGKAIDTGDDKAKEALDLQKKSIVVRNIGNANIDTEITFEYGIRKLSDKNEKKEDLKKMPFQLQITYTAQDGSKAVRVYTKEIEFTTDRSLAERNLQIEDIIFVHNAQMMSDQVLKSNIKTSKYRSTAANNLISRTEITAPRVYSNFSTQMNAFSSETQARNMDDQNANDLFYQLKMTRMKLKK